MKRFLCGWRGHPLTEREYVRLPDTSPMPSKVGALLPISQELLTDTWIMPTHYHQRCRCGKIIDPATFSVWDWATDG